MSISIQPARKNLAPTVQGDTYPAFRLVATGATAVLDRVTLTIRQKDSETDALVFDSDESGITINDNSIDNWDFTIDEISKDDTGDLPVGFYEYSIKVYYGADTVRTHFQGEWEITER
jgi:hypothetical protein